MDTGTPTSEIGKLVDMTHTPASFFSLVTSKIQNITAVGRECNANAAAGNGRAAARTAGCETLSAALHSVEMLFEMSGWWGLPSYGSAESGAPHRCLSCLPMFLLQPHFCSRMAFFCAWKRARRGGRLGCYVLCYVGEVMGFNGLSYHVLYV